MAKSSKRTTDADYDIVISKLFEDLVKLQGKKDSYSYTKDDLVLTMEELKSKGLVNHIRNIPDIKYTYDARKDFPLSISKHGWWAIIGAGKSRYRFEKIPQNNLIRVPTDIKLITKKPETIKDVTHNMVQAVLGNDEQATMTRVRYNELISKFLKMEAYQVQGHERTTVSVGQIEVDEVYVGQINNKKYIIPISAKGGDKDCLSYTQAFNLALYATEKERFSGYIPIPLGVLRTNDGSIYVVRFSCETSINDIKIEDAAIFILT